MKIWMQIGWALFAHGAWALAGPDAVPAAMSFRLTPDTAAVERCGQVPVTMENGVPVWTFARVGDYLRIPAESKLNPQQGTIAFYVKELDSNPDQRVWNPYFQWQGGHAVFQILRLWQPLEVGGGLWRGGNRASWAGAPIPAAGEWHHWALTYQKNLLRLFRDGQEVKSSSDADFIFPAPEADFTLGRAPEPGRNADRFYTGNHLWTDAPAQAETMRIGKETYGAYAIKEFCAFQRPLSATEITRLYKQGAAQWQAIPTGDEPKLEFAASTTLEQLRVLFTCPGALPSDTLIVRIADADGVTQMEQEVRQGPGGSEYVSLPTAALPVGAWRIVGVKRSADGAETTAAELTWTKETPPAWLGNNLGKADVVLPGFEALKCNGSTVSIWGREYDFGKSLLPQQIVNQGHPMLVRPIDWQLTTAAGEATLHFDAVKSDATTDTRAMFSGQGTFGPFAVSGSTVVEYDGFMDFTLTFTPPAGGVEVNRLQMEIPLAPEEADLLFYESARQAEWPEAWRSAVTPIGTKGVITLGNADRCLQWLIESDQYFFPEDNPEALQTHTTPAEHTFTVDVIGAPRRITEPFTLHWMLQTGPVKARPSHWRGWTRAGRRYIDPKLHNLVNYQYDWWARSPGEPIPADGFPAQPDPEFMRGVIPCVSMHFGGFRATREKTDPKLRTPEWQRFETEWQRLPLRLVDDSFPGWNEQTLDTKASSWGDWHVWCVNELLRTTGVRGLYYDDWLPGSSTNEFAGSGYVGLDGTRRATRDIRNQREFHRRVYALVKQYRGDDGIIFLHVSGCPLLPVLGFADIDYDGEVMVWSDRIPPEGRYFDSYRMDIFRQLFSARQLGPVPGFHDVTTKTLTVGGSPKILLKENQRQLWALLLLHDIHIQSAFTSGMEELRYLWLDSFGIAEDDVEFTGYWDKDCPAKLLGFAFPAGDPDRASKGYVSVYTRPGKALVIVVRDAPNNYAGSVTATVELDRGKLGLPSGPLRALDMESMGRTPLGTVTGNRLEVPVNCDDFAAVLIEP